MENTAKKHTYRGRFKVIGIISLVIIALTLISEILKPVVAPTLYEQLATNTNPSAEEVNSQTLTQNQNYQSLVKTAIAILIQPNKLMQETKKLGIAQTFFPKATNPTMFDFYTKDFQTSLLLKDENTLAYINISTNTLYGINSNNLYNRNVVKNLTQADLDSLGLMPAQAPYTAYGINAKASDVYRQFQYKDNPDIHVFFVKERDRDIDKYFKNPHYAENLHTFDKITVINCSTNPECHE